MDERERLARSMDRCRERGLAMTVQRRAILEELYRRAGERHRPTEELDYLNRLLRRF